LGLRKAGNGLDRIGPALELARKRPIVPKRGSASERGGREKNALRQAKSIYQFSTYRIL